MQIISLLPLSVPIHHLHYPFLKQAKNKKRFKKKQPCWITIFLCSQKEGKNPLVCCVRTRGIEIKSWGGLFCSGIREFLGSRSSINKERCLADQVLGKREGLDDSWLWDIFLNDTLEPLKIMYFFFPQNMMPNYLEEAERFVGRNVQIIVFKKGTKTETKENLILWSRYKITFCGLFLSFF